MDILEQYVIVIVMAVCVGAGFILKHTFTALPNKYIPLILAVLGIGLNSWMNAWAWDVEILAGGIASGLMAVGAFELGKQLLGKAGAGDGD
jgi:TctA family transporter